MSVPPTTIENKEPEPDLVQQVQMLMVHTKIYGRGSYDIILPALIKKIGRPVKKSSLCMAMTSHRDYRKWSSSRKILEAMIEVLSNWPTKQTGH